MSKANARAGQPGLTVQGCGSRQVAHSAPTSKAGTTKDACHLPVCENPEWAQAEGSARCLSWTKCTVDARIHSPVTVCVEKGQEGRPLARSEDTGLRAGVQVLVLLPAPAPCQRGPWEAATLAAVAGLAPTMHEGDLDWVSWFPT